MRACPSGLIKSTYGNEYSRCESPEIGTGKIINRVRCAFHQPVCRLHFMEASGAGKRPLRVGTHRDDKRNFLCDGYFRFGIRCHQLHKIFHSLNPLFISYRGEYIVALVISVCICVASMAIRVYAIRSLWAIAWHERISRGGRRMSTPKDALPIVRDVDVQRARLQSTKIWCKQLLTLLRSKSGSNFYQNYPICDRGFADGVDQYFPFLKCNMDSESVFG